MFDLSYKLYNEIISPDINIEEFVDIIIVNIGEFKNRPGLNRCKKAFKKIEDSVKMLKDNFSSYYRDFVTTKNSTIIMEHFIIDVSKSSASVDPELTREFRTIIGYYRKAAENTKMNPQVQSLFDRINESFKQLERNTENLVNVKANEADSDPI